MKNDLQAERAYFWSRYEELLTENGNPFSICYKKGSEYTFWAVVNKKRSMNDLCLSVDFLAQKRCLRINIYICDDLYLWNKLCANKDRITSELGMNAEWTTEGVKNPNTRRIQKILPLRPYDRNTYDDLIEQSIVILDTWRKVFSKYIPNLFDF